MVAHRLCLPRRASAQCALSQQPSDRAATGGRAHRQQPPRQRAQRQVGPQHACAHRIAGGALLSQVAAVRFQGRLRDGSRRAPTPLFRMRPAAASSSSARSRRPGRMVCGSHAKTRAMSSTPPGPSLATSTAAYRRRSFSDSQPKNRCIFCSTSAAYTSMPHSLIRALLCSKDTAAQAIREVILDHILRGSGIVPTPPHPYRRHLCTGQVGAVRIDQPIPFWRCARPW